MPFKKFFGALSSWPYPILHPAPKVGTGELGHSLNEQAAP